MQKKKTVLLAVMGLILLLATSASAYEAFLGPTGLLKWTKGKTYDGYTLWGSANSKNVYLIDMNGQIVNVWETDKTSFYAELLPNGNLLKSSPLEPRANFFGGAHGELREYDWDGNVVWEFVMNEPDRILHHAFYRMPNGNTLALAWEKKSWEEAVAKGRTVEYPKEGIADKRYPDGKLQGIWPDYLIEIDPSGKIVWEWHVWDHLGTGEDQFDLNYVLPATLGAVYAGPDWTHFNSVYYDAENDQVLLNSRNFAEFYIIDHKSGKMLYRWGNPSTHGKGKAPGGYMDDGDQIMFGPHHVTKLANGNVSILDNGTFRPSGNYTRVIEMDPKTGKIVWEFAAKGAPRAANSFYSAFQCAAQKLPNGNYFVTSTTPGHMFEVTPEKEVVWEFVNPIGPKGPMCTIEDVTAAISLHRGFRYGPDYSGLKGKDLSPKGYVAGDCPDFRKVFEEAKPGEPKVTKEVKKKEAEDEGPSKLKAY